MSYAIDSAFNAISDGINDYAQSLVDTMKLCTSFMSSIMNNLLDVRKMEEGKMTLNLAPIYGEPATTRCRRQDYLRGIK